MVGFYNKYYPNQGNRSWQFHAVETLADEAVARDERHLLTARANISGDVVIRCVVTITLFSERRALKAATQIIAFLNHMVAFLNRMEDIFGRIGKCKAELGSFGRKGSNLFLQRSFVLFAIHSHFVQPVHASFDRIFKISGINVQKQALGKVLQPEGGQPHSFRVGLGVALGKLCSVNDRFNFFIKSRSIRGVLQN